MTEVIRSRLSAWARDWRGRAAIAGLSGIAAALLILNDAWRNPAGTTDFDQVWYAARAVRQGLDPYSVIGPTGPFFRWDWQFYYPMTAVMLVMPLSFLPLLAARVVFVAGSAALLAYGLAARPWRLLLLLSAPVVMSIHAGQWSLLFAASLLIPSLAIVSAVKPNLGAAVLVGNSRRAAWVYAIVGSRYWPVARVYLTIGIATAVHITRRQVQRMAWASGEHVIALRGGWLWRSVTLAPVTKIQTVTATESPFDRRLEMAGVRIDTAGGSDAWPGMRIPYLARDTALALAATLSTRAAQTTFRW